MAGTTVCNALMSTSFTTWTIDEDLEEKVRWGYEKQLLANSCHAPASRFSLKKPRQPTWLTGLSTEDDFS